MDNLHLQVNHLLVLVGVMLGLVAHELVLWWARRRDTFHLWAAAWAAATVVYIFGHYFQRATGTPEGAVRGTICILSAAVALMPLSVGTARSVMSNALPRAALPVAVTSAAILIGCIIFSGYAVPGVYLRTDAFGITYWDNDPGVLHQLALAFIAVWSVYIVRCVHRTRNRGPAPRRTATRWLALFLLPLIVNDILHGADVIDSVELIGYGFCVVAIGMSYAMTRRHERSLEGARALIQGAPDAILVHRSGRLLFVNPAAHRFLQYEGNDLQGRAVDLLVPEDQRGVLEARYEAAEGSPTASSPSVETFRRSDGSCIRGEVVRIGLSFDGEPAGATIVRDVSEREEVQRQLRLADRMVSVGTLAARAAHEINNPLAYVIANVEEALRSVSAVGSRNAREVGEALGEAREGALRVRQVVRDIAIFSRSDEEVIELVDVRAALESAVSLTQNQIRDRAKLTRDYGPGGHVRANPARLGQVFVNLLTNAAQAIADGTAKDNEIRIVTRSQDDTVVIEVHDTGVGLPQGDAERLFDPFYTTKPIGEGTGLGLSVCHGIIRDLGGTIELRPQPSGGTIARVMLAAASETELLEESVRPAERDSVSARARILVVDDEPVVGRALKRVLSGHEVTLVTSGEQALQAYSPERFDVIVCDLMMPGMTGIDVYEHLRGQFNDIDNRIVFMTGGVFTHSARDFLRVVRAKVIQKPFDRIAVQTVISDALKRPARTARRPSSHVHSTSPPAA